MLCAAAKSKVEAQTATKVRMKSIFEVFGFVVGTGSFWLTELLSLNESLRREGPAKNSLRGKN